MTRTFEAHSPGTPSSDPDWSSRLGLQVAARRRAAHVFADVQ